MSDPRELTRGIFARALAQCSVASAFRSKRIADEIDLRGIERVAVVAAGKGAATMLEALAGNVAIPPGCELSGVLIAPGRPAGLPDGTEFFAGGHPLPNADSFAGARRALDVVESAGASRLHTFCVFLISGGASAMMELPLDPAISLEDTVAFHRALVHSGASITEINCVRKHFSAIKGGRLGQAAAGMPNLTLLVSDVPSGQLDSLASGPTLPDRSTVAECREVLARYGLMEQFPEAVRSFFQAEPLPETPKPGEFEGTATTLLSSDDLAEAARKEAVALGFATFVDNTCDDWESRAAAKYLVTRLRELRRKHGRVCLISAGEVTVKVTDRATGKGGRNQHFALQAAELLNGSDRPVAILSAGSDGVDGNSPAAGGVVDCDTVERGLALGESIADALNRFDSFGYLARMGGTVVTGPTGNNLRDLRILLAE